MVFRLPPICGSRQNHCASLITSRSLHDGAASFFKRHSASKGQNKRTKGERANSLPHRRVPSNDSTTLGYNTFSSVSRPYWQSTQMVTTRKPCDLAGSQKFAYFASVASL